MDTLIELLPSEPKLTEETGVSQDTIRRALDDLVLQGSLVRHQGRGTVVTEHTPFGFFISFVVMGCVNHPRARP